MTNKKRLHINLIKNRKIISEKDYLREKKFFKYSQVGVVVAISLVVLTLLYQLFLAKKLTNIENSVRELTTNLDNHAEASTMQIYLKNRLRLITTFLDSRKIARQAIQDIFSIDIPGVIVSGLSFQDVNVVKIQFEANNVLVLDKLLSFLKNDSGVVDQVVSDGLVRTAEGDYQLQTLLTLVEKAE